MRVLVVLCAGASAWRPGRQAVGLSRVANEKAVVAWQGHNEAFSQLQAGVTQSAFSHPIVPTSGLLGFSSRLGEPSHRALAFAMLEWRAMVRDGAGHGAGRFAGFLN
ncbi:hypothetical protein EDB81DRAFT_144953 [Dactylonectria macrodidyma]|uniref:Uncharacterized protein n=1 Tax=Dactylonectria macrodidyma TaxID=307937 RepID=A0A9P9DYV5_9HYPO|nr:hypothetical protein EDB81DRAFT_144953 [Dactylonectria macrodidyma]